MTGIITRMEYLKRRQKTRKRLYSKITIGFLVLVMLLLIRPTWNIYQKSRESKRNVLEARAELLALEHRKTELERDVTYIKSEHGRDQEIRSKFGMAKEGETMVVIVRDEEKKAAPEPTPEPTFWEKSWSRFRSVFGLE